jgi:NAD(P)-dependent dehydrogenase (short-subunit alcohol dehydrogenase family)
VAERRRVLVTGGGTGIGLACAEAFAQAGCAVGIAGRRKDVLDDAVGYLAGLTGPEGGPVLPLPVDLGTTEGPQRMVEEFVRDLGGIDVLVNAAGTCSPTPTLELTAELWDSVVDAGLRGAALASVAAGRVMAEQGGGRIVMITSIDEQVSEPNVAHYCAAKAGLGAFARSLAVDAADRGIRVNSVAPGWVATTAANVRLDRATPESMARLNALGRAADAAEVADVVRWLGLDAPDYLTGSTITVDGGQTVRAAMP